MLDALKEFAGVIELGVVAIGATIALLTYRKDSRLRRSEWLYRLYKQFYENNGFDPVRRLLDYAPPMDIAQLKADLANNDGTDLHEAFVDYLNFFEFIAIQMKYKNIRRDEVLDMFDYYIRRLGDHTFIVDYIKTYGFENLEDLLVSLGKA